LRPASWHFLFSERRYLYCARYRENIGFGAFSPECATLKWLGVIASGVDVLIRRINACGEAAGACQAGLTVGFCAQLRRMKNNFSLGFGGNLYDDCDSKFVHCGSGKPEHV
jgi:hypothetical protein